MIITDLRRDLSPDIFTFMQDCCDSPEIKAGFRTSVQAAYRKEELEDILAKNYILHRAGYRSSVWPGCYHREIN